MFYSLESRLNSPVGLTFIAGQLGLGGAEKQLYLLARELLRVGWRISVITLNPHRGDYWEEPLRELGIPVYGIADGLSRFHRLMAIRRLLCQQRVQIVHAWMMHANLYAALGGRLSNTPIRIGSQRNHHTSRESLGRAWYNMSLRGLDSLVVNCQPAAEFLRQHRPKLQVKMVPNGVEVPESLPDAEHKKKLRELLGISRTAKVIGAVGSMIPRKNVAALIKAIGLLSSQEAELELVLIGDGPLRRDLERQALSSLPKDMVRFTGAIPNAAAWFPAFDLLCLPSLDLEGTPNVLIEASAAGLPVVVTRVGGVAHVVDDGVTGLLVPPQDVHALANRIGRLLVDSTLRRRMGEAGREKMRREFSVKAMAACMTQVYEEAFAAKGLSRNDF
ncbi:glycosyltransferase [candidate division KSB1 bacterium]|nr:glycosyltransferase [candidate division KSB1 bacterium]